MILRWLLVVVMCLWNCGNVMILVRMLGVVCRLVNVLNSGIMLSIGVLLLRV